MTTWTTVEERQVRNPDYAFAYCTLASADDGQIGYGVGVGGRHDYPNSCFGILGDYVVYYFTEKTAAGDALQRPFYLSYGRP